MRDVYGEGKSQGAASCFPLMVGTVWMGCHCERISKHCCCGQIRLESRTEELEKVPSSRETQTSANLEYEITVLAICHDLKSHLLIFSNLKKRILLRKLKSEVVGCKVGFVRHSTFQLCFSGAWLQSAMWFISLVPGRAVEMTMDQGDHLKWINRI